MSRARQRRTSWRTGLTCTHPTTCEHCAGSRFTLVVMAAADDAVFGIPAARLGVGYPYEATKALVDIVGAARASEILFTGGRFSAEEALRIGLIQEIVEDVDAGLARAHALAASVARKSPTAVAAFKQGLLDAVGRSAEDRTEVEAQAYEHCLDSGQAAIGRENFSAIRAGDEVPWGPRIPWSR